MTTPPPPDPPPIGAHVNVTVNNCVVISLNADSTWALLQAPIVDPNNPVEVWLPTNGAPLVNLVQSLPANWPPLEGDMWIVPGITGPAFVVTSGGTDLYFLTPDQIRAAYNSQSSPAQPMTTNEALAQFGSLLSLQFRQPPKTP